MDGRSAFQFQWQYEHQKLYAMGRHESSGCSISTFIWRQIVWCRISVTVLISPYLFEEATPMDFVTCSVTASRYTAMLQNYVIAELLQRNALNDIIWMQDNAPPHITKSVRRVLEQHFGDRIISSHFPFSWPLGSPDLTPMNFWFFSS